MRDADSLLHLGLFRAFRNSAGLWSLSLMFSGQLFPFLPLELPSTRGSCRMVSEGVMAGDVPNRSGFLFFTVTGRGCGGPASVAFVLCSVQGMRGSLWKHFILKASQPAPTS